MTLYVAKPIRANLELNGGNKFARGLAFAAHFNDPTMPRDLVSRRYGTVLAGVDTKQICPYGKCVTFAGSSTSHIEYPGPAITHTRGHTFLVLANPIVEARNGCLISQRNSGGAQQLSLYTNTGSGFSVQSGTLFFQQSTSIAVFNGSSGATSAITGEWSWYGASSDGPDGGSTRYYVDGDLKATVANVTQSGTVGQSGETLWVGAPANFSSNTYTHNRGVAASFIWNYPLTTDEIREFISLR